MTRPLSRRLLAGLTPALNAIPAVVLLSFIALIAGCGYAVPTHVSPQTGPTPPPTPQLTSIAVGPSNATVALGLAQQFTATGFYTDGTQKDVSSSVSWNSSAPNVAFIGSGTGLAATVSAGSTTITAALGSVTGSTTLTVTAATLISIALTPAGATVAAGAQTQFTAIGTYTDGSTQTLTSTVTWTSANTTVATIINTGLATAVTAGSTTVTATLGGTAGSTTLTVSAATLVSIVVTPANPSIAVGVQKQFTATGTYTDKSTQTLTSGLTWASATPTVTSVTNTGLATAVGPGSSTITATFGSVAGTTTLFVTVAAPTLVSIAVTPTNPTIFLNDTQQFIATGTYRNGSTANLSGTVIWNSSNTTTATISNAAGSNGLAAGLARGTTLITATFAGITSPADTLTVTRLEIAYATNFLDKSVSQYTVGPTGLLTALNPATVTAGTNPFSVAVDPTGSYAYVANAGYDFPAVSSVSQYAIGADGSLSPMIPAAVATGANPNSVTVHPSGKHVYVANFGANYVSQYAIGAGGSLTLIATVPTGSEPAMVAINPAGTYAYVANFGDTTVSQYTIDQQTGMLISIAGATTVTADFQPNFIAIDPNGQYVYVANYGGGTISQYSIGPGGALTALGSPVNTGAASNPRSIAIDPVGGHNVYVANGGSDSVSQFTIATDGVLMPMATGDISTGAGTGPNSVTVDVTGRYLYVADRGRTVPLTPDTTISQFSINPADGSLTPLSPPTAPAGSAPASIVTAH